MSLSNRLFTQAARTSARAARSPLPSHTSQSLLLRQALQTLRAPRIPNPILVLSRFQSTTSSTPSNRIPIGKLEPEPPRKSWRPAPPRDPDAPAYELYFTCNACEHRSGHNISKQAYHGGTVLVQCPSCKNRHLIADHLKIFSDQAITLEDIMKEQGQHVEKGRINSEGDVELLSDEAVKKTQS